MKLNWQKQKRDRKPHSILVAELPKLRIVISESGTGTGYIVDIFDYYKMNQTTNFCKDLKTAKEWSQIWVDNILEYINEWNEFIKEKSK